MSDPRLVALQDAYSNLQKATHELYMETNHQYSNFSTSNADATGTSTSKSTSTSTTSSPPSKSKAMPTSKTESNTMLKSQSQSQSQPQQEEETLDYPDDEDPAIAAFYRQQAKKQKMQNTIPYKDWALLHLAAAANANAKTLNQYQESSVQTDDSIEEDKLNCNLDDDISTSKIDQDFQRIRKQIKGKLIDILKAELS